ncbi:MAG: hypothetical protein WCF57_15925 [Pyrinomonadaceae bacterium]
MVDLAFPKQLIILSCERALDALQFLAQKSNQRLRMTSELCAGIFELIFKTVDDSHDSVNALIVKPLDVSIAVHRLSL